MNHRDGRQRWTQLVLLAALWFATPARLTKEWGPRSSGERGSVRSRPCHYSVKPRSRPETTGGAVTATGQIAATLCGRRQDGVMSTPTAPSAPFPEQLLAHTERLARLVRALVADAAALDVVHDTYKTARSKPPRRKGPLRPWLGAVARNIARMTRRSRVRREHRELHEAAAAMPTPEELVARVEMHQPVVRIVLELPEPLRGTLLLRYFEDMSSADMARAQGIPAATVRSRFEDALDHLRATLDAGYNDDRRCRVRALAATSVAGRPTTELTKGPRGLLVMIDPNLVIAIAVAIISALGMRWLGWWGGDAGDAATASPVLGKAERALPAVARPAALGWGGSGARNPELSEWPATASAIPRSKVCVTATGQSSATLCGRRQDGVMSTPTAPSAPSPEQLLAHTEWLSRLARAFVGDAAAPDVVQDTFEIALSKPPRREGALRPWLGGVARNIGGMTRRSRVRRERRELHDAAAPAEAIPTPEELLARVEMHQRVARIVFELPEPLCGTLLLRYFEDMSAADIARAQGIPAATVRSRLKDALGHLRAMFDAGHKRERPDTTLDAPFLAKVLGGVNAARVANDLQLVPLYARSDQQRERALHYVSNRHVDGVLLLLVRDRDPMPTAIMAAGIPLVALGRPLSGRAFDYVDTDNMGGSEQAVRHLVAAGRRCLASVAGPLDMSAGIDRLRGFVNATRAAGMPAAADRVAYGDFTEAGGHRAMKLLLERTPEIDGVFVASDLMCLGALQALRELGRKVPDDVAVVGFDDVPLASYANPPLTTVRQQIGMLGQEMMRSLLHRLSDPRGEPTPIILPTELVVRSSA
jgi:RNA polymerase sigma factor (sigma-70 family)